MPPDLHAALLPLAFALGAVGGDACAALVERLCARVRADLAGHPLPRPPLVLPPRCHRCHHPLRAIDRLPLVGDRCHRRRHPRCPAPTVPRRALRWGGALLFATCVWRFGASPAAAAATALGCALMTLAAIDRRTRCLPHEITTPALWGGLLLGVTGLFTTPADAILGAALGYALPAGLHWTYSAIRRRQGMGGGDFVLLGVIGAWLGWQVLPAVLLVASATALLAGASARWRVGDGGPGLPFGPHLALAALLVGWLSLGPRPPPAAGPPSGARRIEAPRVEVRRDRQHLLPVRGTLPGGTQAGFDPTLARSTEPLEREDVP